VLIIFSQSVVSCRPLRVRENSNPRENSNVFAKIVPFVTAMCPNKSPTPPIAMQPQQAEPGAQQQQPAMPLEVLLEEEEEDPLALHPGSSSEEEEEELSPENEAARAALLQTSSEDEDDSTNGVSDSSGESLDEDPDVVLRQLRAQILRETAGDISIRESTRSSSEDNVSNFQVKHLLKQPLPTAAPTFHYYLFQNEGAELNAASLDVLREGSRMAEEAAGIFDDLARESSDLARRSRAVSRALAHVVAAVELVLPAADVDVTEEDSGNSDPNETSSEDE
jgi:hypothetical protein